MTKFEKFFASRSIMFIFFFVAVVMYALKIAMLAVLIPEDIMNIIYIMIAAVMFCASIAMYRSYAKHEPNALNILVGAMLGLYFALFSINIYTQLSLDNVNVLGVTGCSVMLALFMILFVNHVQINSVHKSTRGRVLLNQVILIILAAYQIVLLVYECIALNDFRLATVAIADSIARIGLFIMIICVETKLNAYKIDRDVAKAEGTWTDEMKAETKEKHFGK